MRACARSANSSKNTDCAQVEWLFRARDPFFNVNTPDDLLRAREWLTTRPEP